MISSGHSSSRELTARPKSRMVLRKLFSRPRYFRSQILSRSQFRPSSISSWRSMLGALDLTLDDRSSSAATSKIKVAVTSTEAVNTDGLEKANSSSALPSRWRLATSGPRTRAGVQKVSLLTTRSRMADHQISSREPRQTANKSTRHPCSSTEGSLGMLHPKTPRCSFQSTELREMRQNWQRARWSLQHNPCGCRCP